MSTPAVAKLTVAEMGRATHIRGLCTMRNTSTRVAKEGRIKMTWDDEMNVPYYPGKTKDYHGTLAPLYGHMYRWTSQPIVGISRLHWKLSLTVFRLITRYPNAYQIHAYIHKTARSIYRRYKSYCHKLYKEQGMCPIPIEFEEIEKEKEWFFLCAQFETLEFKEKLEKMTNARKSKKKKNHKASLISFANMACKFAKQGHHVPLMKAHAEAYSGTSKAGIDAADAELKEMEASQSTSVDQLTSVENENLPQLRILILCQVQLMTPIAGSDSGTRYWGFGDVHVREPLLRGLSKGGGKVAQSELEALKEMVLVAERERDEERRASIALEARMKRLEALFERGAQ